MRWSLALPLLFAAVLATPALAESPLPEQFHSEYTLRKGPFTIGHTERTLRPLGNGRYRFESISKPRGIAKLFTDGKVEESSVWTLHEGWIRPLEYSYFNSGRKNDRRVELRFDWEHHKVTNTINGDPWTMDIEPRSLDKFVYQLAVMLDLERNNTELQYHIADGGRLKTYEAVIKGEEQVSTPLGDFDTVVVERDDGERVTTLWCAKKLSYLPVKIGHTDKDGSTFYAELEKLNGL